MGVIRKERRLAGTKKVFVEIRVPSCKLPPIGYSPINGVFYAIGFPVIYIFKGFITDVVCDTVIHIIKCGNVKRKPFCGLDAVTYFISQQIFRSQMVVTGKIVIGGSVNHHVRFKTGRRPYGA